MSAATSEDCRMCDVDHRRGSPECPAARLGRTIAGKYELKSLMGVGGMGAVYRARHKTLGTDVAIKMIHHRFSARSEIAIRFDEEARRVAALRHPGIVQVADLGRDEDGCPYIEMELLNGRPVDALVREGPLPVERALDIMVEALDALAYAHERGVVHRDLKPENLFLVDDRHVKILDFGIAKAIADAAGPSVTETGTMMGTPPYMSPEQLTDSKHVDQRTDIYAMGATLFELLTGQRSVTGATLPEVISNVLQGNVQRKPSARRGQLPTWIDDIVQTALATSPGDRYASASLMKQALEAGRARPREVKPDEVAATMPPTASATVPVAAPPTVPATAPPTVPDKPAVKAAASTVEPDAPRSRAGTLAIVGGLVVAGGAAIAFLATRGSESAESAESAENAENRRREPAPVSTLDAALVGPSPDAGARDAAAVAPAPDGMVRIAGARFDMGSTQEEVDEALIWCSRLVGEACPRDLYERELPRHAVEVAPFFLDRTEITNRAFATALATAGATVSKGRMVEVGGVRVADLQGGHAGVVHGSGGFAVKAGMADLPVVQITWEGAAWYCASIGKRLPTEAEWELASRGVERRTFPWGSAREPACDQVIHARGAGQACASAGDRPAAVGTASLDHTPDGVRDLGGNVAEWVEDRFAAYDAACGAGCVVREPAGKAVPRVARGGYFDGLAEAARAAGRSRFGNTTANVNVGARCAQEAP
ncbi:MAG TPA: bifunctional serine/threonine-protein kinase/formylglycine-generating enzyme family protein [Kofleriaceae bacterium]|nr:bifunctional serine/threonine-protein kinase/formylglycine-generating enzyme family protein [Kofleriaceae bacterium]